MDGQKYEYVVIGSDSSAFDVSAFDSSAFDNSAFDVLEPRLGMPTQY